MDYYTVVIIITFFAFSALAAALLIPVYRFLKREEADGKAFTKAVKEAEADSELNRGAQANEPGPSQEREQP